MKTKFNLYGVDIERYYETLRISGIIINVSAFRLVLIKSGNKGAFIFNSPFSGKFWEEGTGFLCAETDSLNLLELPNLFK